MVRELLVSQTPMGMSGREKDAGLSLYTQWNHAILEESICQNYILSLKDPKQSHSEAFCF